jgi:two-component system nitrogen regulation sensor histidine kinase NtrY
MPRWLRWGAVGAVAITLLWLAYRTSFRVAEAGPEMASRQILPMLTLAILALALGFVFILVRNVVRLVVDRKRGVLGARLRTKLVFFFLALVLLPAFLLSFGAASFIKTTVQQLLRTPVDEVTAQAKAIVKEAGRREEDFLLRHATLLAAVLAEEPSRSRLKIWREAEGFDLVAWTPADGPEVIETGAAATTGRRLDVAVVQETVDRAARLAARSKTTVFDLAPMGGAALVIGAAPIPGDRGAVVVGQVVKGEMAARLELIDQADQSYADFRAERREVLRIYYSLIVLVGLAIVFVSSWIGFYVSRRITVPLEQVAAASREISQGNLGVRVLTNVGDEVGMLVDSFNEMAAELQESREVITRGTAELRRSNQALDERRRYIETLVAQLGTGVISADREMRVTTCNPAASTMLGAALTPGDDLSVVLASERLAPLAGLVDEARGREGRAGRKDMLLERPGGPLTVAAQVSPIRGSHGEDLGMLLMLEDLTDLLDAQRAAAWREVARRIAHEIKNPLTPIQLAAQRLRKKFSEGSPDLAGVIDDSAQTIEREVSGLKKLVDEFSLYARMPGARPEPVDFASVIESVVALYRVHPSIRWSLQVAPDLGVVRVDPEQMRRALINLIDNAITAMGGTGEISIAARSYAGPGSLRVEVSDRGPGIPVPIRETLFTPYVSTKPKGTGLGLAIVQRVVAEHRGTIRVEDAPEGGARFVIEIPGDAAVTLRAGGVHGR